MNQATWDYGLWRLVVVDSAIFLIFAFSFYARYGALTLGFIPRLRSFAHRTAN
jgi:hypothetical protein